MNLTHFLLLLTVSTTWAQWNDDGLPPPGSPMFEAIQFQMMVNKATLEKETKKYMRQMFWDEFKYEACDGKLYDFEAYVDVLYGDKGTGRVIRARADRRFIIYQVQFATHLNEVMIRKSSVYWKFVRAQELICPKKFVL